MKKVNNFSLPSILHLFGYNQQKKSENIFIFLSHCLEDFILHPHKSVAKVAKIKRKNKVLKNKKLILDYPGVKKKKKPLGICERTKKNCGLK